MAAPDKISSGVIAIGFIFAIAVIAGFSTGFGKVMVVVFFGFLLYWLIAGPGSGVLGNIFGKGFSSGGGAKLI